MSLLWRRIGARGISTTRTSLSTMRRPAPLESSNCVRWLSSSSSLLLPTKRSGRPSRRPPSQILQDTSQTAAPPSPAATADRRRMVKDDSSPQNTTTKSINNKPPQSEYQIEHRLLEEHDYEELDNSPNHNSSSSSSSSLPMNDTITTHPLLREFIDKKRIDVAIVGLPNAGKSQLINHLCQTTVSAVSRKRHTTRRAEILGARTVLHDDEDDRGNEPEKDQTANKNSDDDDTTTTITKPRGTQIIFCDTPGFLRPSRARAESVEQRLLKESQTAMRTVDFTLIVVDAARTLASEEYKSTLVALMINAMESTGRHEFDEQRIEEGDDDDDGVVKVQNDSSAGKLRPKFALVLNKIDLVSPKKQLLETAMELVTLAQEGLTFLSKQQQAGQVETVQHGDDTKQPPPQLTAEDIDSLLPPVFYTDARSGEGMDDVLQFLLDNATPSVQWPVDPGEATNQTMQRRVQEIIREKVYRVMHKEVPYAIEQENQLLKRGPLPRDPKAPPPLDPEYEAMMAAANKDGDGDDMGDKPPHTNDTTPDEGILIHQNLLVYTKSHQELVRGTKGRNLRTIRETATRDLEKILGCKVHLHLHVKLARSKNRRAGKKR